MANASAKKLAATNKEQLSQLHRVSAGIYAVTFAFFLLFHRSVFMQAFMCLPGLGSEYVLEKWCRPTYGSKGEVVRSGHGFNQGGVIEYLKDFIYLTWACLLVSVVAGFKAWLIMLVVPVYGFYQAGRLLRAGKQMLSGPKQTPGQVTEQPQAARK